MLLEQISNTPEKFSVSIWTVLNKSRKDKSETEDKGEAVRGCIILHSRENMVVIL